MMETTCNDKSPMTSSETSCPNGIEDNWHIEAVLGPEYLAPVRTVDVFVDLIVDKRQTSRLVQDLQHLSPIPSLRHLKRVNPDGRIIIRLADDPLQNDTTGSPLTISKDGHPKLKSCDLSSDTGERDSVAKKRSYSETAVDSSHSACGELKNNNDSANSNKIICTTTKSFLKEETKEGIEEKATPSSEGFLLSAELNTAGLRGHPERFAVPATPPLTRKQFLEAQGLWACNFHPSRIVEAALAPGAGLSAAERGPLLKALRLCAESSIKHSCEAAAAAVHPRDGHVVALAVDTRKRHPLQHAAMRLVDLVARSQGGGAWAPVLGEEVVKDSGISDKADRDSLPYLCTGLDVVITREPCAMCAMALTHARARRVFFSEDNPQNGVLYSHSPPIHTLPGLNHRLNVFRAPLPESTRS